MRRALKFQLLAVMATVSLLVAVPCYGDDCSVPKNGNRFLRISRSPEGKPVSLDTSIVRYSSTNPGEKALAVDLISAVHVGELQYFAELNRRFQGYEALLYELIKPEGVKLEAPQEEGREPESVIAILQHGLKRILELEFQLDQIDYSKKNFVHADMSPEQFAQSMKERGESFFSMFLTILLRSSELEKNNPAMSSEVMLLRMLMDPGQKNFLRRIVAMQFENVDALTEILNGKEGSTIIGERNRVALEVMQRQIEAGRARIGIYYGAGHMPDMERRLLKLRSLQCREISWIKAWDLSS